MEYDDHRVRIFIALFDYDPTIMSPNPDALDEELPFKEGQLIKIYGDKDPDGFYLGEACGHRGLVPCNMVSEVQVDDPDIAAQLLRESNRTSASSRATSDGVRSASRTPATSSRGPTPRTPRTGSSRVSPSDPHDPSPSLLKRLRGTSKRVVAVYDYDPVTLSPNVDAELELSFRAGQKLVVYGEMDDDGFYYGELDGQRGLVPSNFLEEIREPPAAAQPRRESPRHRASSGSHRSSGGSTSQQRSVSRGEGEARHNGKDGRGSSSNPRERVKSSSDSRGGPREGSAGSHRSEHRSSSSHADKERKPSRQSPHKTAVAPSTERPQDQPKNVTFATPQMDNSPTSPYQPPYHPPTTPRRQQEKEPPLRLSPVRSLSLDEDKRQTKRPQRGFFKSKNPFKKKR
ncbi:hypothetical protein CAPTEDRAFT_169221 [Capitella teleta]|uniref:SH3 domain-containing protein n=1 Tax=Capitella teleta TaxID=283909 RepID=R7VDJ3_CAPTE|nr:hypothetical protein CAPTEDRAFT_169221 [Capitella teleta]|eukprot:ELU13740.1 hypothetical protein CAPTEDRAFT_169221 [Capitella teleta]